MTKTIPNILVFDSGVGGLSIVQHIREQIIPCNLLYLADNELFPYGLLSEQRLVDRATQLLTEATQRYSIDIIIIACNTASTLVLPKLRQCLSIPIVGVVPAIKPAASHSQTKVIGLLATPGTIARDYTDALIGEFAHDCEIIRVGSAELVDLAEQKMAGQIISTDQLSDVLEPFRDHKNWQLMDTVVLACTHFPLLKTELQIAAPSIRHWVDSGDAIARRVVQLLQSAPVYSGNSCHLSSIGNKALLTRLPYPATTTSFPHETYKQFGFHSIEQW